MATTPPLTRAAEARLRAPRTRGAFRPIDAARRQLGLLQVADADGQAAVSWLIDLEQARVADARFVAFGSAWSHAAADAFTQLARGMTVAEACAIRPATVEGMLRDEPGTAACPEAELAFIADLQARALAALPGVKLLPKPAEKLVYQRKRQQDWDEADRKWLPLSLLKKIKAVDEAARRVLADKAPAATCRIEGLHDDFRVVCILAGVAESEKPTLGMFLDSALHAIHPALTVELADDRPRAPAVPPAPAPPATAPAAPAAAPAEPRTYTAEDYKYGFKTDIEAVSLARGLNEDIVRQISAARGEPDFLLQFRLKAYRAFTRMTEPSWAKVDYPPIDYQAISYYSAPKQAEKHASLDEIDPKMLETFAKLGIPLDEQKRLSGVAVDAVFDSVSVATTHQEKLFDAGVIFCPIREAVQLYPALVERWIGSVVPAGDNWFAALNSAVFSDGSFVYIPPHVKCPLELSTYFRINNTESGQFERTLIIADRGSHVSYLEGCTAPKTSKNQLHAAVVELVAMDDAEIKYSTVQNWYAGDPNTGLGGVYNFVTKRGLCRGDRSKISWTQVEAGSSITWKYPSCVLKGDDSVGEFYSVALTNGRMQADTGTKMIHIGKRTRSTIISKGISAERSRNVYRGLVQVMKSAEGARNYTCCDSMLVGKACEAHTYPYVDVQRSDAQVEHEASTSRLSEDQLFYLQARGIGHEEAVGAIVNGFAKDVLAVLPMEFAAEARKLLQIKLENSVG